MNALAKFETENAELKIKLAALARERSALSVMNGAAVAAVEAAECVEKKKSSASTTGGLLSLTSRWHQWESEVRKGDKRLGIILKHYKRVEYELERANERAESAKTGALFAKHELQATREAMDELGKNYAAAEELLNDELRRRESLEKKLREQTKAIEEGGRVQGEGVVARGRGDASEAHESGAASEEPEARPQDRVAREETEGGDEAEGRRDERPREARGGKREARGTVSHAAEA